MKCTSFYSFIHPFLHIYTRIFCEHVWCILKGKSTVIYIFSHHHAWNQPRHVITWIDLFSCFILWFCRVFCVKQAKERYFLCYRAFRALHPIEKMNERKITTCSTFGRMHCIPNCFHALILTLSSQWRNSDWFMRHFEVYEWIIVCY